MERQFAVEAKSFQFSVVEGALVLRVEERRKGFSGVVHLGPLCFAWLASTLDELLQCSGVKDFVKSFWEGSKVSIAQRDGNRFGRYLRWQCMQRVAGEGLF
jgi:hypothetical protein